MVELDKLNEIVGELVKRRMDEAQELQHWVDVDTLNNRIKQLKEKQCVFLGAASKKFKPGDIVVWKSNMQNRQRPSYGEPAIVVQVLDNAVFDDSQEIGSPYFREPLDVILGIIDTDNDFICYHFDSRRFEVMR